MRRRSASIVWRGQCMWWAIEGIDAPLWAAAARSAAMPKLLAELGKPSITRSVCRFTRTCGCRTRTQLLSTTRW